MGALMAHCESPAKPLESTDSGESVVEDVADDVSPAAAAAGVSSAPATLAQIVADAECDEMLADTGG